MYFQQNTFLICILKTQIFYISKQQFFKKTIFKESTTCLFKYRDHILQKNKKINKNIETTHFLPVEKVEATYD